jgi:hypothetical protein
VVVALKIRIFVDCQPSDAIAFGLVSGREKYVTPKRSAGKEKLIHLRGGFSFESITVLA